MKRCLVFLVLFIAACVHTKAPLAIVTGVVVDKSGVPLPGVTVTIDRKMAVTDAQGEYAIRNVRSGKRTLTADLPGFAPQSRRIVIAGDVATRPIVMSAAMMETITVTAQAPPAGSVAYGYVSASAPAIEASKPQPQYAHFAENDFIETQKERTATFSIDVDRAAYASVRRYLRANQMPPVDSVRIEEMINYFAYHYPAPADGRPFAVSTEVAGCPWAPQHRLLRIGLQAKSIEAWKMVPNHLTFLIDVSGSMEPPQRLPLIKSAFRLLVDQLRAQDTVAIVVYAGAAGVVLPPTSGADKQTILAALDKLHADGGTAGGAGIELAYKTAEEGFDPAGNNRVILATDGDFNVGVTSVKELTDIVAEKRKKGIYLSCLGVGDDNFNDAMMESLADHGNGNYNYLDSIDEAKKVFISEFAGTMVTVAKDVKVQLEFDPAHVVSYRQIGYEDRGLANKDFEDDTKDAGELGSGHSVTALYEIVPAGSGTGEIGQIRVRYKEPESETSQLLTASIVDEGKSAYAATPDMQFAAAVAEFGMLLRKSPHRGSATYADVSALARAMQGEDLEGWRDELLRMVDTSRAIDHEAASQVAGRAP